MTTIMLGMPNHNDIYQVIIENLQHHGFDVTMLSDDFRYPNLWIRLQTKFRQKILGDKEAKTRLTLRLQAEHILPNITPHDYALFIRGDMFHNDIVRKVQQNSRYGSINYQWDGMNRYPEIWNNLSYFDRFFVFDPIDYYGNNTHGFLPTTNFYFDHLTLPEKTKNTFYFVGSHIPARQNTINTFAQYAQKQNWQLDFCILAGNKTKKMRGIYPFKNIQLIPEYLTYHENLDRVLNSNVLVDFVIGEHSGLSFRPFEALGYRKKLITTNATIRYYDFYHENNIFIWDGEHLDGIDAFLAAPYHDIAPEIREKYAFGNWIRYILNIEPHQKITLPNIKE